MTATLLTRQDRNGIAVVTLDNPPVNALGQALRQQLGEVIAGIDRDPAIRVAVLTGAGRLFAGGADITEFDRPPEAPHLPDLIAAIEGAAKPWIAAVNGPALGGGAELALGCHYRIAAPGAHFGLPETTLGIIPGAGGTQRLPRLIGVEAAVEMIAANRRMDAAEALAAGLADRLAGDDLIADALAFAQEVAGQAPLPAARRKDPADPGEDFWAAAEAKVARAARGNPAPAAALAAIRHGISAGFDAGMRLERASFLKLRTSDEAAALRYLFFAERAAARPAALRGIAPRPVARVGVVGGGTMGTGIAVALANAGLRVVLSETGEAPLARALERLDGILATQVKRGLHDEAAARARRAAVTGATDPAALAGCDLVIEAVFEDLTLKREVFARLAEVCGADTILATNTSYLDPEQIVRGLPGPERFIALHFFSPAQVMKLLEIVPLAATAPEVAATGFDLARRLGKVAVRAGNCEGFIGNRILLRYRTGAEAMLRDGITPAEVDAAMRGYGFAMGPFEMQDMAGLDVAFRAREGARALGRDVPETPGDILVRAGRLGQKTGGGWYDYAPGSRQPQPSAEVAALLAPPAAARRERPPEDIARALVAAMADEGHRILAEGIASGPEDIDLVEVHGYGFPRPRGGPMFQAARGSLGPGR